MALMSSIASFGEIKFYKLSQPKEHRISHWFSDDEILVRFSSGFDAVRVIYTDYWTLKRLLIYNDGCSKFDVYNANQVKFRLEDYKENQETFLYCDGKMCEMVKKSNKTLLRIKDVKLCRSYRGHSVDIGLNWTAEQFKNIASSNRRTCWFEGEYTNPEYYSNFYGRADIFVLDVSFTNGSKVILRVFGEPGWAHARPGMLVTRYKIRQVTVYELK